MREHWDLLQDREAVEKQKEWFREQVSRGARSLNIIGTRLYPYQEVGAVHLTFGRRAMLADDMGLGKTVEAIAACALLRELRDIRSVLVICPASLKHQWAREIRKLTTFPVTVVEGGVSRRRELYAQSSFFIVLNYELALRDGPILERLRSEVIILDEAQRIKNWRAKTADAVKCLRSRYAFVLTGTPLENRLDELYSVLQFLDPRILGPLWKFNERYFELERRKDGSHKVLGYKNLDELRSRIAPVVLRAEVLVSRFPGRILLVRRASPITGSTRDRQVLVVVDREPGELRPPIEALLREHFGGEAAPGLHLMEREGYRTLLALSGELRRRGEEEAYRAPALPAAFADEGRELRLRRAQGALEQAAKRLRFAEVVVAGGFPEEALRPLRDALGWGLTAGLALAKDREPGPELPSPREVESELVETGRLPEDLAVRLSRARELTEPPEGDTPSSPPSGKTLGTLVAAVRDLIEAGEQHVVAKRL